MRTMWGFNCCQARCSPVPVLRLSEDASNWIHTGTWNYQLNANGHCGETGVGKSKSLKFRIIDGLWIGQGIEIFGLL